MKIFKAKQVREVDAYTISNEPIASIDLMERASKAFTQWFVLHFDLSHKIIVFAGPGNNGGDALAIARMLYKRNYNIKVYFLRFNKLISDDCMINYNLLKEMPGELLYDLNEGDPFPIIKHDTVIIDGIFGSGLNKPVTGFPARIISFINHASSKIVSVDIPSGLFGEDNQNNIPEAIVRADYTITFQFPFLSFFFSENYQFTGEFSIIPIGLHPEIIKQLEADYYILTGDFIQKKIKPRSKFSHKGNFGHALLISGSKGMMGAAIISTRACLRGGAGLVTTHVPACGYQIIQTAVPEALVSIDKSEFFISEIPGLDGITSIGIGPGISQEIGTGTLLIDLIEKATVPLVIDADGLNILSSHKEWYKKLPENTILTPHPKEFDRLAGESKGMYERHLKQLAFAKKYKVILILKGAYTIITLPDGRSWFNMTGNPGMATGGSGDVLTGLIVSLLAQNYNPADASMIAVYLHGLAADIAVEKTGQQSLIAGDITDHIGDAFILLKTNKLSTNLMV